MLDINHKVCECMYRYIQFGYFNDLWNLDVYDIRNQLINTVLKKKTPPPLPVNAISGRISISTSPG